MTAVDEPVLAYKTSSWVEARALAAHLAEAGIDARVVGDHLAGGFAGLSNSSMSDYQVWVATAQREEAEPLIASWQGEHGAVNARKGIRFPLSALLLIMTFAAVALAGLFGPRGAINGAWGWFALTLGLLVAAMIRVVWKWISRRPGL